MPDVYALVEEARSVLAEIVACAVERLSAGDAVERVQTMVATAYERLEDLELYALLARPGDVAGLERVQHESQELKRLRDVVCRQYP